MKQGDKVMIKHQKELGVFTVSNPCDPTEIKRVGGDPVGYYVRIGEDNLGYHESNLEVCENGTI